MTEDFHEIESTKLREGVEAGGNRSLTVAALLGSRARKQAVKPTSYFRGEYLSNSLIKGCAAAGGAMSLERTSRFETFLP